MVPEDLLEPVDEPGWAQTLRHKPAARPEERAHVDRGDPAYRGHTHQRAAAGQPSSPHVLTLGWRHWVGLCVIVHTVTFVIRDNGTGGQTRENYNLPGALSASCWARTLERGTHQPEFLMMLGNKLKSMLNVGPKLNNNTITQHS
jgi:hypothetical protein